MLLLVSLAVGISVARGAAPATPLPENELSPIVITTDKLAVETLIDRKVYSVKSDVQSTFGSASDILGVIPSVDVDSEGSVSLRGDTNVLILVDGRPSALFSGPSAGDNLQSFPASQIEHIEIMTTPPAQYKASGAAGIINIITRRKRPDGVAGSVQASRGNEGRAVAGVDTSYSSGPLTTSITAAYRQEYRHRLLQSDLIAPAVAGGVLIDNRSTTNEDIRRYTPPLSVTALYAVSDRQTLSLDLARTNRYAHRSYTEPSSGIVPSGSLTSSTERFSSGQDHEADTDARLGFTQKMARPNETLELSLHQAESHQREHYDYTNLVFVPPAPTYQNNLGFREGHRTSEFAADYVLPRSNTRTLKLGYGFEQEDYQYDAAGGSVDPVSRGQVSNPRLTDDFRFRQRIDTLYGSYQASVGDWNWLYGLRGELTRTDTQPVGADIPTRYLRVYPSLHVDRIISDRSTLSFGASRRVSRPDAGNLDPYIDQEYLPNLRSGNPNLRPQYTQAYEFGYAFEGHGFARSATVYYRRNKDSTTDVVQDLGNGITLATKANLPRNDSAGLEFSANGHVVTQLAYSVSGNLFYSQIDATSLGASGLQSTTGLNAKLKLDYRPTAVDSTQLTFTRTDKRLTPQGYVGAINIVNLGYKRQLRKSLTAIVTASDLFNGQRVERTATTPAFTQRYVREIRGRVIYVGLVYTFGTAAKEKPANFDYDQ